MKKRIKIDSTLLSFIIIMTGFLFVFQGDHLMGEHHRTLDTVLDFVGFITLLKGILLRMSARGHKKAHSGKSQKLVVTGPYTLVRNPMYLGSFLMGAGFVLMVWPWWTLPIFAALFYVRFKREVVIEEKYLMKLAKEEYTAYCAKVPRIFPSIKQLGALKIDQVIDLKEAFSTKEKRGLWGWPLLAVLLESLQERIIFGATSLSSTIMLFLMAAIIFVVGFAYLRQRK